MKIFICQLLTMVLFFPFSSCGGQNSNKKQIADNSNPIFKISLEEILKSDGELNLSEIADDVDYIELKKITGIRSVGVSKEYIFINNNGDLHKFDKQGNYICPIGRCGRGPNEYIFAPEVSFNEELQRIYVINNSNIMVYSFDGNFVEKIDQPMESGCILMHDSIIYQGFDTFDGFHYDKLLAINSNNDTLFNITNYHKIEGVQQVFVYRAIEQSTPFYQYGEDAYYRGYSCDDTIYQIKKDTYNIHAIVDMGKFKRPQPKKPLEAFREMVEAKGDYYQITVFLEDDNRFYLKCHTYGSTDMKAKFCIFDKKSLTGYKIEDEYGGIGINDDINGGAPFIPTIITDDSYIAVKSSLEFIEQNEKRAGSSEKLRKFLSTITDESNPIITFVHKKQTKQK